MRTMPFDRLTLWLSRHVSRRVAFGGLAMTLGWDASDSDARKKRKRKKKKCAKSGQKTSKKRKKCCRGLVKDAAKRCAPPRCACPADHICLRDGECQLCNATCPSGNPVICGALLQTVLNLGETLYICPGVYRANFSAEAAVTAIGAGDGADPASNTILEGNGAGPVLTITSGAGAVELERLRLTGGNGGISHHGTTLHMTECTVSGNADSYGINTFNSGQTLRMTDCTVSDNIGAAGIQSAGTLELTRCTVRGNRPQGFAGGGGLVTAGTTTLTDCLIEDNSASGDGGGIHLFNGATTLAGNTEVRGNAATRGGGIYVNQGTLKIAETCRVTENSATAMGDGGGIYNTSEFGVITLQGADPSPIVANNCHENCAGPGGVPKCAATPVSCSP